MFGFCLLFKIYSCGMNDNICWVCELGVDIFKQTTEEKKMLIVVSMCVLSS